jgi:hypothetical protein
LERGFEWQAITAAHISDDQLQIPFDSESIFRHHQSMLTLGMFLFLGSALLGCVWWVCAKDDPNRSN